MVDTQTFQVFDSWILPIGMSSCPGRLQKKEGQTLTTFRCIHVATYYGKMGQLSGCGLLTCMEMFLYLPLPCDYKFYTKLFCMGNFTVSDRKKQDIQRRYSESVVCASGHAADGPLPDDH